MRIVVGLGNPGIRYSGTRHNVGFWTVRRLATRWSISLAVEETALCVGRGRVSGIPVLLVEPRLFMNRSGSAVACLDVKFRTEDLIVIHDDVDLEEGRLRIRHNGGCAGHRGVESLAQCYGSSFDRVRVGVGRPPTGVDPAEYVLARIDGQGRLRLENAVAYAALAVECLLVRGIEAAMNQFNVRPAR